ncbi:MAG: recombinase family protein [Phycisphaerales bacterium]|nr:recombinase family protein [Planctomycetota bacterium]MCH8507648.1 recombinase family protein [Phycisphaerales bacterium]
MTTTPATAPAAKPVRCAVYTRKSTEEGLSQAFNSLDAQRDSAELYIKSQGWICLPDRYDDGGCTGANTDRPGLQRLLADIKAGRIDCVVVYKVDRLSRSLADFSRLMETFDAHKVSFVAVTQHFNTTSSMGRLTLNILLSFAQFERELISERTRDKIAGARRQGKWAGGRPGLGYDLVPGPGGSKLVVNAKEAARVRAVFEMYLRDDAGMMAVVGECARRGWTTKAWTARNGKPIGGRPLNKDRVYHLLTNVLYTGRIRHKDAVYPGEHEAIIDDDTFERAQAKLRLNGRSGGSQMRNVHGALLKGLVRCGSCGSSMTHTFSVREGGKSARRYRYYACSRALKQGRDACPCRSLPAADLEKFVAGTIRDTLSGDGTLDEIARRATALLAGQRPDLVIDPDELLGAAEAFDPVWDAMTVRERITVVHALVERVVYDDAAGTVSVTFREGTPAPQGQNQDQDQPGAEAAA